LFAAALVVGLAIAHDTARAQSPATLPDSTAVAPSTESPDSIALAEAVERVLPRPGLLRADRLQHLSLSFALALGVGTASDQPVAGAAVSGGVGLLKEVDDGRRGHTFDRLDLLADLIGAGLGALLASALRR
jgi:hypothetical protein